MRHPFGALLATEWLKVRTIRLPVLLAAGAGALTLVLALPPVLGAGRRGNPSVGTAGAMLAVLDAMGRGPLVALVLGVLLVTAEQHHGTITPVLLQTPSRARLLLAKAALGVLAGGGLGLLGLVTAMAVGILSGAVTTDLMNADIAWRLAGLLLAHPAYALFGVGVGALAARSQPIAVALPVAWLLFGEAMLIQTVNRDLRPWGMTGATEALANAGNVTGVQPIWVGGALLLVFALLAVAGGTVRLARADVT